MEKSLQDHAGLLADTVHVQTHGHYHSLKKMRVVVDVVNLQDSYFNIYCSAQFKIVQCENPSLDGLLFAIQIQK